MKGFLNFLFLLFFACGVSTVQAQPPQKKAPANRPPQNKNHASSNQAAVPRSLAQQHNVTAAPSKSQHHTPSPSGGSYYYTGSGHYYNPVSSGDMHYYSSTTTNSGYWYTGKGQYYTGNEHYYNPVSSGDMHYSSPTGSWYSGNGQYYSPRGSYYISSNAAYTSAQGQYTPLAGSYQASQSATAIAPQTQNVAPQNRTTPQPAALSSMNTASAADAANSIKAVTQGNLGSPSVTLEGGLTTPGGTLAATYNNSGVKTISATVGEGPLSFSGYLTSQQNYGVCWSPGFDVPGAAKLNLNACAGTDGASFGASGGLGPLAGSVSIPSQDVFNLYMDSIYGVGNWLGTGLYSAAPSYFNGSH